MGTPFLFRQYIASSLVILISLTVLAQKAEILIYPFSEVPANEPIRLGHIAGPVLDGPSRFSEIEDMEILGGRQQGDRYFMGRIEMVRALEEKISSENFTFRIPNQIIIESKKNYIHKNDITRKILVAARQACSECNIFLKDLKIPNFKETEENLQTWYLDLTNIKLQGSFMIPLKVEFPSGSQTFWVTGYMDLSKEALVARRQISPGERISENDFEKKVVNVTFQKGSLLSEDEIKGKAVSRFLMVGQPFISGDIRKEAAATRGQIIKVLASDDTMEIALQAVAEENGFVGDMIKIKNTETMKMMTGKIIDKGVVKLQ